MTQTTTSPGRFRRLAALVCRKWFWMPLAISMVVASLYWGWEYARFRHRVTELKSLDADFKWAFEKSGPDWVRQYLGHPTKVWNTAGPICYGPFDRVVNFNARARGRTANVSLDQVCTIAKFKHVKSLRLKFSAATDDWLPEIAKIRSLEHLGISHCRVSGRGFATLANMPNLKSIGCTYCPLRDEHLLKLASSTSITDLNVTFCTHLTTDGIAAFLDRKAGIHVWMYGLRKIQAELKERGYRTDQAGVRSRN